MSITINIVFYSEGPRRRDKERPLADAPSKKNRKHRHRKERKKDRRQKERDREERRQRRQRGTKFTKFRQVCHLPVILLLLS